MLILRGSFPVRERNSAPQIGAAPTPILRRREIFDSGWEKPERKLQPDLPSGLQFRAVNTARLGNAGAFGSKRAMLTDDAVRVLPGRALR